MSQEQPFSDQRIRQTIDALTAQGQDVTPWAVQAMLGGGDYLRIQHVMEQHLRAAPEPHIEVAPVAMAPAAVESELLPTEPAAVIDKQMPASIEATMYQMQKTFGDMASQLWSDVAATAQTQVESQVSNAVQAQRSAERQQRQMREQIQQLDAQVRELDANFQTSVQTIEEERQQLIASERQRDELQRELTQVSSDKQLLEQNLLDANIRVAKAEGLIDITREQLTLAKQREQQAVSSLERAEKRVDILDKELQSTQRDLSQTQYKLDSSAHQRDELASQLHDSQLRQAAEQALRQELQERQLPQYSQPQASPAPAPAPPAGSSQVTDLGHSFHVRRQPTPQERDKSRSLSDKLFERKSRKLKRKS
ncbi:MAG: DNA-binding protein [Pseudomonadales bacterium]